MRFQSMRYHFLLVTIAIACLRGSGQSKKFGKYRIPNRIFGDEFVLKSDQTFTYNCIGKTFDGGIFTDTSAGNYFLVGDTIILKYTYNIYNPKMSDTKPWNENDVEPRGYFGNRPQKLLWKRKKLYYINEQNGNIYKTDFLKRTKYKRLTLADYDKLLLQGQ